MTTPTPLVHTYYYQPTVAGTSYDPIEQGGAVLRLRLYRVNTLTLAATAGPAVRVSYGVYRFDVPGTVEETTYLGEVDWTRATGAPTITDDSLVVSIPDREVSQIKPWVSLRDVLRYHPDVSGIDPEIALDTIDAATQTLYALSGRKYRGSRVISELYKCDHGGACKISAAGAMTGYSHNRRSHSAAIQLRGRPVQRVIQVSLDSTGEILSPNRWRLVNARYIEPTRHDWSPCQGVRVTYAYGVEPTRLAKSAALAMAGNMALAYQGSEACRLPDRVTSVSRQGVSYTILDPQDYLSDGRVGLYEVDLFLKSANPDKARMRPRVVMPDGPRAHAISSVAVTSNVTIYPLVVTSNAATTLTYVWRTSGVANPIAGTWQIRARAGDVDLSTYVTIEPGGETGRIDLSIPWETASALVSGSTWFLDAVRWSDVRDVVRLLTGDVRFQ